MSDKMIELLKSGKINNRLLCELSVHEDFLRLMIDLEIYDDNELNMRTLELAQMDEDNYFACTIFKDLRPIIQDIREAHKSDVPLLTPIQSHRQRKQSVNWKAPSATKGVRKKSRQRVLLSQLEVDYDALTQEKWAENG